MKSMVFILIANLLFGQVQWESNYYAAVSQAKEENRFMMIYFTMPGASIIKDIDQEVWNDFEIEFALDKKVLPVKINAMIDAKITNKYQTTPPALFIISPTGEIVHKIEGMLDRNAVLNFAEKLPESPVEYLTLSKQISSEKKDAVSWQKYSRYCLDHGLYFSAYHGYMKLEKLKKPLRR